MTDDELAEYVTHDVLGHYGEPEPAPNRGCLWTLAAIAFFVLLAILL